MATDNRSRKSRFISFLIHAVIIAAILWLTLKTHAPVIAQKSIAAPMNITLYAPPPPPKQMPVAPKQGGGGGGGAHQVVEPTKGRPPVVAKAPVITAPQILRIERPKLAV